MRNLILIVILFAASNTLLNAKIKLPAIFGDHMVLQRDHTNPVWGWAEPGDLIKVDIHHQSHTVIADEQGRWHITLRPIPVGGPYQMKVEVFIYSLICSN